MWLFLDLQLHYAGTLDLLSAAGSISSDGDFIICLIFLLNVLYYCKIV